MANLYKITFKSKSGKLAPLEIFTTSTSYEKALQKVTCKIWQNEAKYKEILHHFAIFPSDYIKEANKTQLQYFFEKCPSCDYITNNFF